MGKPIWRSGGKRRGSERACWQMSSTLQRLCRVCKLSQAASLELHIVGADGNCRSQDMALWRQVRVAVWHMLSACGLSGV